MGEKGKKKKKLSKNQRRRLKKRQQKKEARERNERVKEAAANGVRENGKEETTATTATALKDVEIEFVSDTNFQSDMEKFFSKEAVEALMSTFKTPEGMTGPERVDEDSERSQENEASGEAESASKTDAPESGALEPTGGKLSRSQKKKLRMSVAELKRVVEYPDVVEVHDVNSADPKLLVHLKAYPNTVPIPRHWCAKSKYLQRKRGIEKLPFKLPDFIEATGISKMRSNEPSNDEGKTLRQRARERMNAKMGKIDIDYQVLYTAFFKNQKKPPLTRHGDIYYEGKEFEQKQRDFQPGNMSESLRSALGMLEDAPPPWLINMQRYGPPPSYPKLRIPGLNAPIPKGASFGYHPGGWGKPPVDAYGMPLYGDVFGTAGSNMAEEEEAALRKMKWGEMEEDEEEEDEGEEEEEDEGEIAAERVVEDSGAIVAEGTETPFDPSGTGHETPLDTIDIRKGIESVGAEPPANRQLYQVIEQKSAEIGGAMYGSDKRYVIPSSSAVASEGHARETEIGGGVRKRKSRFGQAERDVKKPKESAEDDAPEKFKF